MTITSVTAGEIIDPDWGNGVADQLNGIVSGSSQENANASGIITVAFGVTFATAPVVTVTRETTSGSGPKSGHFNSITTTGFTYRCFDGTTRQDSVTNIVVHWIAIGELA